MNQILKCEIGMSPPSVNHYWLASGKRRYISAKGRAFQQIVALYVKAHLSSERLRLNVTFHFPDKTRRDIDNHLKALLDSLVKAGLCIDDEQFDEIVVKRGNIVKGGLVELEVWEI
ncbi:RusA family crossover junction endodeoxyribonuclease [Acinetobacter junii]|uniref:RusA family crossover junction endodeoxyribonuclease n=1 Tax=Acinetobacter junii TaxID=40215 RepID=UPI0021CDBAA4|nr:RusA family crossover junction endodeoxyribonuclease [Acinetobacter junii]MCU4406687.1 RusA family crossover junction endodeoxyribonuclease [Acinetobacter junii]